MHPTDVSKFGSVIQIFNIEQKLFRYFKNYADTQAMQKDAVTEELAKYGIR